MIFPPSEHHDARSYSQLKFPMVLRFMTQSPPSSLPSQDEADDQEPLLSPCRERDTDANSAALTHRCELCKQRKVSRYPTRVLRLQTCHAPPSDLYHADHDYHEALESHMGRQDTIR